MLSAETHRGNREASGEESYGRFLDNRFRYYDPASGRYLGADPIGQYGDVNLFVCSGNNPVVHGDPLGLQRFRILMETAKGPRYFRKTPEEIAKQLNKRNRSIDPNLSVPSRKQAKKIGEKAYGKGQVKFDDPHPADPKSKHPHAQPKKRRGRRGHINIDPKSFGAVPGLVPSAVGGTPVDVASFVGESARPSVLQVLWEWMTSPDTEGGCPQAQRDPRYDEIGWAGGLGALNRR